MTRTSPDTPKNYTFKELIEEIELAGGSHWLLSRVPLRRIRCWNTRTPLARLLTVIADDDHGNSHIRKVHLLAAEIRRGTDLPGIVVTNHRDRPEEHSILSGYRRLAAHRVASAAINGVRVRLSDERWRHIVEHHDDLAGHFYDVLETIASPGAVYDGDTGELLAVSALNGSRVLVVVYRELSADDGFVITAFFTTRLRQIERRRLVWKRASS